MSKRIANSFEICLLFLFSAICIATAEEIWERPFKPDNYTVALFHFDNTEGNAVIDSSKNKNHGKLFGLERRPLAAYGEGKFLSGVECCDSGWVDVPDQKYYAGMDKLTVEAWVLIYDPKESIGVLKSKLGEIVSTPGYTLRMTGDAERIEFIVHTSKGTVSAISKPIEFEEWHHVAGTYNGKECHIFIDGRLADSKKSIKAEGKIIAQRPARPPDRQYDSPGTLRVYSPVTIGGGMNCINAVVDEVRISDCVRYKAGK